MPTPEETLIQHFTALAALPDAEIALAPAALRIAATAYPDLDVPHQLSVLDSLARAASRRTQAAPDPLEQINRLSAFLFDEIGFRGNEQDYYDPRNSFLNDVLQRRLGIPITLSLVYLEVAARLSIPCRPIGMPGHLLLRPLHIENLYLDPFHGGILLSTAECAERFRQAVGPRTLWDPRYLAPIASRDFITRMLHNLKAIYTSKPDHQRALVILELLVAFRPDLAEERRDRGLMLYHLERHEEAAKDLWAYVNLAPDSPDTPSIQSLVGEIARRLPRNR
ncbi:MAG: tetratricopeptide repeat protein [Dehalococcoidia bacterium]|nr:tetratricopeptide repeat protein [Dehalococcoidia bacterium]